MQWLEIVLFGRNRPHNPKTVLIYKTGHLGDTFVSIPAFQEAKKQFPKAKLILLTNQKRAHEPAPSEILKEIPLFDEILSYDFAKLRNLQYSLRWLSALHEKKIDLLYYFGPSNASILRLIRDMILFKFTGCRTVRGFRINLHRRFKISQRHLRTFDQETLRLVKIVNPSAADSDIAWNLPVKSYPLNLDRSYPIIAVHPSANMPVKQWPLNGFVDVSKRLQKKYSASIVLIGGSSGLKESNTVESALNGKVINLTGKTTFLETADVLRQSDFLLSNDSGPAHIAAAVGTPVVGVYSAREYPRIWYPLGKNHRIIRKDVPCQVCDLKVCPIMICINLISTDEVFSACERVLK